MKKVGGSGREREIGRRKNGGERKEGKWRRRSSKSEVFIFIRKFGQLGRPASAR